MLLELFKMFFFRPPNSKYEWIDVLKEILCLTVNQPYSLFLLRDATLQI